MRDHLESYLEDEKIKESIIAKVRREINPELKEAAKKLLDNDKFRDVVDYIINNTSAINIVDDKYGDDSPEYHLFAEQGMTDALVFEALAKLAFKESVSRFKKSWKSKKK